MWLFFFHDSEHRKLSSEFMKLTKHVNEVYDYAKWRFKRIDSKTYQVINLSNKDEEGMIVWVDVI